MNKFINTKKEIFLGDSYFKEHVMPEDFDYRPYKKRLSPWWEERGFRVSGIYEEFYTRMNGIRSERYIPMDIYYFYILPALNRADFINAYIDKNIYSNLFPDVNQPKTIVKRINGKTYCMGREFDLSEAIEYVVGIDTDLIIKPTVETANGDGVDLLQSRDCEELRRIFNEYGLNFIVQEKVQQHPGLSVLNPTSLNTYRIFTYRTLEGHYVLLPFQFVRFGSLGSIKDNTSGGGQHAALSNDGFVSDQVFKFKSFHVGSLYEMKGLKDYQVPMFAESCDMALKMHPRLPYFDFVGWDISVDISGKPVFIEFNLLPSVEGPQLFAGPMFGDYLEEVISRCSQVEKSEILYSVNTFSNQASHLLRIS